MNDIYPRWTSADNHEMRVEVEPNRFVDYARIDGAWRQKTRPMNDKEAVTPARYWLGDWRDRPACWPVVDAVTATWLDETMAQVGR